MWFVVFNKKLLLKQKSAFVSAEIFTKFVNFSMD